MAVPIARHRSRSAPVAVAAVLGVLLLSAGCAVAPKPPPASAVPASRDLVVLLPDHQGKTGAILVSGAGDPRFLSKPGQAVTVPAGGPPDAPFVMAREELESQIGAALSALPSPPSRFILYFDNDTAKLTPESREAVREVLRTIRKRVPVDISVVGHTDTVGSRRHNDRLALDRSRAVAALLTREGVPRAILEISSHGKDNPLVPTGDQVSEPRNRRVEVTVR